jgi:membrane protease YdiL (CAAX protease family)
MTVGHAPLVAIGIFVVYTAVVAALWKVNKVDYAAVADSRDSVIRGIVVPIGIGGVLLAVATTVLGWWHPVLFQDGRTGPAWVLVVPVLLGLVGLLGTLNIDWRSPKAPLLPWLALGVVLVGFAEELVCRGILIVGGRQGGWSELVVVIVSCVLFGLLHGINAFFGQSLRQTVTQIVTATIIGASLYATRMSTGTLIVCMLLHALWDFGTLGQASTGRETRPVVGFIALATFAVGLVGAGVIIHAAT